MATFSREMLTSSPSGRPVLISVISQATAVTIHTAHATAKEEVYLWVTNTSAAAVTLNLLINDGSIVDPDDYIVKTLSLPANSPPLPILTGQTFTSSMVIAAFASVNNALTYQGFINRVI